MYLNDTLKTLEKFQKEFEVVKPKVSFSYNSLSLAALVMAPQDIGVDGSLAKFLNEQTKDLKASWNFIFESKIKFASAQEEIATARGTLQDEKIVNPAQEYLGTSYTQIVLDNAKTILNKYVEAEEGDQTVFGRIINKIVNSPIVVAITKVNPILSMARDVVGEAVRCTDGDIDSKALDEYQAALQPYINFYSTIGNEADEFDERLRSIYNKIEELFNKFTVLEQNVKNALNAINGQTDEDKLENLLAIKEGASRKEIFDLLTNDSLKAIGQNMEKLIYVIDDGLGLVPEADSLIDSHFNKMITILQVAQSLVEKNDPKKIKLQFKVENLKKSISAYNDRLAERKKARDRQRR